jgi:Ca2+-transporting ATPase
LPPNEKVMNNPPRKMSDPILNRRMGVQILSVGFLFVLLLFGLLQYFRHNDIVSLTQFDINRFFADYLNFTPVENGLSAYELSLFFTFFVMFQFWNMFNAKAFNSGKSAFFQWRQSLSGFGLVTLFILLGQILIVSSGGKMFHVTPLRLIDWLIMIVSTSLILWIGELFRLKIFSRFVCKVK